MPTRKDSVDVSKRRIDTGVGKKRGTGGAYDTAKPSVKIQLPDPMAVPGVGILHSESVAESGGQIGILHSKNVAESGGQIGIIGILHSENVAQSVGRRADKDGMRQRLRWSSHDVVDVVEYEKAGKDEIDVMAACEYKRNLRAIDNLRRDPTCLGMSFKELVRQLDMAEGGEGLACLPSSSSSFTWGQMMASVPSGSS